MHKPTWCLGQVMGDAPHQALRPLLLVAVLLTAGLSEGRDLLAPKEQQKTEADATTGPSFDKQQRGIPQSIFVSIQMAKGYEVEWDSFGRKGWYTQDPRLKPIEPGTTKFPPDVSAVYVVFEVAPLEDPAQFSAQWFLMDEAGNVGDVPVGKDVLEVPGHERYGFLELKKPADRDWTKGQYLVKLFITPLGQQPFHAVNQVGTMQFTIADLPSAGASMQK